MPLAEWTRIGEQITLLANSSAWWLGDWLIYGRVNFPDRYKRAMGTSSLDYQTLRNYAWVAGRFAASRRRGKLSFQHHATVAALSSSDQDLWLERATFNHWSTAKLRAQLRAAALDQADRGPQTQARLQLTVTADRHQKWEIAARRQDASLPDWMTEVLDAAAAQIL